MKSVLVIFIIYGMICLTFAQKNLLRDSANVQDREHLEEHLREQVDMSKDEKLDAEKMNFHFFKLHDYDDNSKLDGLEIMAALTHHRKSNDKEVDETQLTQMVDDVLKEDDLDADGYLSYPEFLRTQSRE